MVVSMLGVIAGVGRARADEVPPRKEAPTVRIEKKARPLPDGTFEGTLEGATGVAHVRLVIVGHLIVGGELRVDGGDTFALAPQGLASDTILSLAGQSKADGSHDFVRLRGAFDDQDAAFGRWDGTLGNKVGGGAWSVERR